ncbi:hypothetical protein [Campylobacter gracilis]|uniref:ZP domain-containing protein n=1 Tax=Campylobacter gracilis RM3268 TaxID=553220 RepID=C8PF25_9BACT|nr:hypothetical protein [Campylobacter gracilis]AKT91798.1 hypothetical protein CGRAC_0331 [Campylobacter gracilis]EEV18653.1 hypothetical protein CAMGR0001_2666 [Campylobacter gracilis RM3268]UEB45994.1 hypothetical protein LK410_02540 [Campylobacter gracilis]SUW77748.1 Uncharacterised protein [Campylobacter gracilis]
MRNFFKFGAGFMRVFVACAIFVCALALGGCDDEKKDTLQKPPVDSEVPKDVPIAPSEPKVDINADMLPLPVTE